MDVAGVILAAGRGGRMFPLQNLKPKPLFPVNNVPLIDLTIDRMKVATTDIAVNTFHHQEQMVEHLDGRVYISEENELLGTAGAIGALKPWIDERDVVLFNSDAWVDRELPQFEESDQIQMLVREQKEDPDFDNKKYLGVAYLPWHSVSHLIAEPSSLWTNVFEPAIKNKAVNFVKYEGEFIDCGTPRDYLRANLLAANASNVVAESAIVNGTIDQCVIWPHAFVGENEHLTQLVRAPGGLTLYCE